MANFFIPLPSQFQSLIGRLKTQSIQFQPPMPIVVSIPYRQAKNEQCEERKWEIDKVSIPYRQAKNFHITQGYIEFTSFQSLIGRLKTVFFIMDYDSMLQFQSLIGRLKTLINIWFLLQYFIVSIPYRQAKNLLRE